MGLAACEASADQSAAPAAAATSSLPNKPLSTPSLSPVATVAAPPTLTMQEAERAFAEAVRAVALSIGSDQPDNNTIPDEVFVPLRMAGVVDTAFDGEADYFAWSRPRRPVRFLGHEVTLVLAEEMRAGFIGCCVNDGVTLYLRPGGDAAALHQFAAETRCTLEPARENPYFDSSQGSGQSLKDRDKLLALACHERDIYK